MKIEKQTKEPTSVKTTTNIDQGVNVYRTVKNKILGHNLAPRSRRGTRIGGNESCEVHGAFYAQMEIVVHLIVVQIFGFLVIARYPTMRF